MSKSDLEEVFLHWLRYEGIPEPEREYKFHDTRKWRFDFAWPDVKVAVEVEGLTHGGGRHQRLAGFIADCEKMEAALIYGWVVYRIPGQWIQFGSGRPTWRPDTMWALRHILYGQYDETRSSGGLRGERNS